MFPFCLTYAEKHFERVTSSTLSALMAATSLPHNLWSSTNRRHFIKQYQLKNTVALSKTTVSVAHVLLIVYLFTFQVRADQVRELQTLHFITSKL